MPDHRPRTLPIGPTEAVADLLLRDAAGVVEALASGPGGLDPGVAARRLAETGPNELSVARTSGLPGALVRQLTHPLALLLWAAAVLAATTQGPTLAVAITAVIGINAAFALGQERHAEHAVAALAEYLPPHATVVRGGQQVLVEARRVVPGDLLVVEEGDAICADAKIVAGAVECDLSAVTGESAPVVRQAGPTSSSRDAPPRRLVDAADVLLSGTTCTSGEATAVVVHTGMTTELGRIAGLSSRTTREPSPLEQQVRRVAWLIAGVAVGVGLAFLPLGVLAGLGLGDAAVFAIGLLVANVPEGLLPTITLALAVGVAELARRGGLVKRLSAVETLGSTDVICTDKTGTLTQNRMQVHSLWAPSARSAPHEAAAETMAAVLRRCTSADPRSGHGDPTELALLKGADRLGFPDRGGTVTRTFHFDPRLRRMSVVVEAASGAVVFTKGAPESVLPLCDTVLDEDGRTAPWTAADRAGVGTRLDRLADQGLRLLACAVGQVEAPGGGAPDRESLEQSLTLVGFAALTDPLRDAVPDAILDAHRAGITVHVITGDNGRTAGAIAMEAGIGARHGRPHVVNGSELEAMDDDELDALLASRREAVFARNTPEDKLRIAARLQALGHVVAMTGDGVNDAPALRRADIGVAMGRTGTDVAREAATMVLTDDDFATIIRAVQAGRRVYDNVRKFILYIFAHAIPEIVPFLLFALSGGAVPLGLTVTQILLIDLGTETLPALALGREAEEPGIMGRPPRQRTEGIITRQMLLRAWALLGITSAVLATSAFLWVLWSGGWRPGDSVAAGTPLHDRYLEATSMTFAGIVSCQVGTAMAARTDRVSLFRIGFLTNRLLLLGIAFELALTALVLYTPVFQDLLGTRPLGVAQVLVLATFPVVVWGVDELYRWRRRSAEAREAPEAAAGRISP